MAESRQELRLTYEVALCIVVDEKNTQASVAVDTFKNALVPVMAGAVRDHVLNRIPEENILDGGVTVTAKRFKWEKPLQKSKGASFTPEKYDTVKLTSGGEEHGSH